MLRIPRSATTLDRAKMHDWPNASIEAVRDCLLEQRVTAICLKEAEKREQESILDHLIEAAAEAVAAGRMIDAGFIPNEVIKSEAARAKNLIIDGWIRHPFQQAYVIFHTWEEGAAPLLVMPNPDGLVEVQIAEFLPVTFSGDRALLMGDVGQLTGGRVDDAGGGFVVRARVSSLKLLARKPEVPLEALVKGAACNLGDPVWTVMAMLATDGVEVETIPAPERLNKQRAAKGRTPIPSRLKVHSAPYITAIQNRAKGRPKDGIGGVGHHASPVMHLRRGHPRRLPDGKQVWVRDCIVNAKDDAPGVVRSHYAIRHP